MLWIGLLLCMLGVVLLAAGASLMLLHQKSQALLENVPMAIRGLVIESDPKLSRLMNFMNRSHPLRLGLLFGGGIGLGIGIVLIPSFPVRLGVLAAIVVGVFLVKIVMKRAQPLLQQELMKFMKKQI